MKKFITAALLAALAVGGVLVVDNLNQTSEEAGVVETTVVYDPGDPGSGGN